MNKEIGRMMVTSDGTGWTRIVISAKAGDIELGSVYINEKDLGFSLSSTSLPNYCTRFSNPFRNIDQAVKNANDWGNTIVEANEQQTLDKVNIVDIYKMAIAREVLFDLVVSELTLMYNMTR